jgi:phospholipid/cholesterol/gamma-HCH transport system ATP-binding protein
MSERRKEVIEVENLISHYGSRMILDDVNLSVLRGEIMVIMGASGSGKSTLLRHLLGLNRPTSGAIRLFGTDISHMDDADMNELRKHIGVAFQGGALFGSMTVAENVQLPLREHTDLDENTIQIMTRMKLGVVNMSGFEDFMPSDLSGGMTKRAALARAIIMDPWLLFFDEPSAGLDPVVSAGLDELILRLREAMRMTIVVVTHELQSAFHIADRITVLDNGRVVITGTVDEIRACPDERVQDLIHRRVHEEEIDPEEYLNRLTERVDF